MSKQHYSATDLITCTTGGSTTAGLTIGGGSGLAAWITGTNGVIHDGTGMHPYEQLRRAIPYVITTASTEEPMIVPDPKTLPCPSCEGRAVRGSSGHDYTIDVKDHDTTKMADKVTIKENGSMARIRVCANCGHVWASLLSIEEM